MTFLLCAVVSLLPPVPAIAPKPKTNHPYHVTLTFTTVTPFSNAIFTGETGLFSRRVYAPTNYITVSNLFWPTVYQHAAVAVSSNGEHSDFSAVLDFPWPNTNFASVFIGNMTEPIWVETNASGSKYFRTRNTQSGNSLSVKLQGSSNLVTWNNLPGMILMTNSPANLTLRLTMTNNVVPFIRPD